MTKAEKTLAIGELSEKFAVSKYFYLTDCSELNVETINKLRRTCFENGIQLKVVKNTLIRKALEKAAEVPDSAPVSVPPPIGKKEPIAAVVVIPAEESPRNFKNFRRSKRCSLTELSSISVFFFTSVIVTSATAKIIWLFTIISKIRI